MIRLHSVDDVRDARDKMRAAALARPDGYLAVTEIVGMLEDCYEWAEVGAAARESRDRLVTRLREQARFLRWVAGNYKLVHFPGLLDLANELEAAANKEAPTPD